MTTSNNPIILDGKKLAQNLNHELSENVNQLTNSCKIRPKLSVILLGENPASQTYVKFKQAACQKVGIESNLIKLPTTISQSELIQKITELNQDVSTHGILVQLPLPAHINPLDISLAILPNKDVDGFHPCNIGNLLLNNPSIRPCTPYGIMRLIEHYDINLSSLNAVIIGRSNIVGKPMALELLNANATVTICHSKTQDLSEQIKSADLVIAAIGRPNYIKGEWIKPGSTVIDVGISKNNEGKLVGDVEFDIASQKAAYITPVPGGVGPMTVATLLSNCIVAYKQQLF